MAMKGKANRKSVRVVLEHVPASDAEERLRRAYELMLQAAERAEAGKEASKGVAPEEPERG